MQNGGSAFLVLNSQFNCGENEIQASLISSASVGATPTPATSLNPKAEAPKAEARRNPRNEN